MAISGETNPKTSHRVFGGRLTPGVSLTIKIFFDPSIYIREAPGALAIILAAATKPEPILPRRAPRRIG